MWNLHVCKHLQGSALLECWQAGFFSGSFLCKTKVSLWADSVSPCVTNQEIQTFILFFTRDLIIKALRSKLQGENRFIVDYMWNLSRSNGSRKRKLTLLHIFYFKEVAEVTIFFLLNDTNELFLSSYATVQVYIEDFYSISWQPSGYFEVNIFTVTKVAKCKEFFKFSKWKKINKGFNFLK